MHRTFLETLWSWTLNAQVGGQIDIAEGANQGTDWGAVFNVLIGLVALAVVIVAAFFLVRWLRNRQSSSAPPPVNTLSKDKRRRIQAAEERGEYETAGDLYARAGFHEDAAESYARARAYLKAAREFHTSGNLAQAIHFYKEAGELEQAARLYADQGEVMAAAAEYVGAENWEAAADYYCRAGDYRRAGENYERAGDHLEAARNFDEANAPQRAAENYSRYFEGRLRESDNDLERVEDDRKFARRAGQLFKDAGENQLASEIFQMGGFYSDAAGCLRTSGDYSRAAEMLMQAKQPEAAAKILEEAGQQVRAFKMRAEAALHEGDAMTAAKMFREAGDTERAAEIFEQEDAHEEAASLYEKLGDHKKALKHYVAAEKWAHAAKAAEALGKLVKAAEYFRQAGDVDGELRALTGQGDFFRAGRLQFEHRRYDDALKTLERIDSRDPIYPRALELQGDVYRAQNRFEKAYSKYRGALGNREAEAATLPLFYKMARALEEEQDFTGALDHYNQILEVNEGYEDVALRVKAIRRRRRRGSLPGGAVGSGIFASPEVGEDGEPTRYEIVDEIARGGMGIVYKARDTVLGRVVAFKILGENLRDNETAVKYFLREARAAAALSHPNIVTIFDAGEQEGEYYMAMEFVEGTTLKELVRRKGALPEDQVRFVLINGCRALKYAHSKGIIHRDIKSGNVMITRDKSLKIMDFGLAKFIREYQKEHTQQVGTPFYMSPEQIRGTDIDFRSDLYSLGCTIFECATGTVPFFKGDLGYHHIHTKPPAPRSINPALSREMEKIILRLLEKDPDDRFQSASDVLEVVSS